MELWRQLHGDTLWHVATTAADILLVAYVIYRFLLLIKGTRAVSVLGGLFLLIVAHLAARLMGFATFDWMIGLFLSYGLAFGLIVVFQDEIRRGLATLGRNSFLARFDRDIHLDTIDEVVAAAEVMAAHKVGALLVLERTADLSDHADNGVAVDAQMSSDLILTIFHPGSALHDGALIISKGRVAAARCLLPPGSPRVVDRELGTRHQAALGLTEEVDAAVVVVSEERGEIALAVGGRLHRPLDPASLRRFLRRLFVQVERRKVDRAPLENPAPDATEALPAPDAAPERSS